MLPAANTLAKVSALPAPHSKALAAFFTKCCPTVPVLPAASLMFVGIIFVQVMSPVRIILLVAVLPAVNTSAKVLSGVNATTEPIVNVLVALLSLISVPMSKSPLAGAIVG